MGEGKETVRLEAFSDGVFAIAITLLILELRPPHDAGESGLRDALLALWPSYVAFALSFATILVMWMSHHGLLLWVQRVDGALMAINGLVLAAVTFVPFPTAILGERLGHPGERTAMAFYAATFLAVSLAYTWLWAMLVKRRADMAPGLPESEVNITNRYIAVGVVGYALAIVASLWSAALGLTITLAITAMFVFNVVRRHRLAA